MSIYCVYCNGIFIDCTTELLHARFLKNSLEHFCNEMHLEACVGIVIETKEDDKDA